MSPRLEFALNAAIKGGRFTLAHFNTGAAVEIKSDATPVTVADKGAERIIREEIAKAFPHDVILGEEEGETASSTTRWVIDPIDGTKSFVSGVPLYATLLSYEVDGVPILGVSYFPALDEIVFAEKGQGAFWNGRPCRVSTKPSLTGAVVSCGSHASMGKYHRADAFQEIAKRTLATRTWSDAYGHALVATGRIEAMCDPIVNHWDISAVSLIVAEAGGRFTDFDGIEQLSNSATEQLSNEAIDASNLSSLVPRPSSLNKYAVISSNGLVHPELLEAFRA